MAESYSYVALLDVLGYRDRLNADRASGKLSFRDDLQDAFRVLDKVNEADFQYQSVSDTIILSCASRDKLKEFVELNRKLFLAFLECGLLIRGGLAYGQHFKGGHVTYSHALTLAYEGESERAIYPRIVLDPNLLQLPEGMIIAKTKLVAERNGTWFINVVRTIADWNKAYETAKSNYLAFSSAPLSESAFAKHVWFESYLLAHPLCATGAQPYINGISFPGFK